MTAPDALTRPISRPPSTAPSIAIGLERPLNPDHLAFLAANEWGLFAERGITVALVTPGLPDDAFAALAGGSCDLALIEPLQLLDAQAVDVEALGCILRGEGGVLMREDRLPAFRDGDMLRIASSMAGSLADDLCRRILQGWAAHQGLAVAGETMHVEPAGPDHLDNLLAGYDGAWIAVHSGEEAAARLHGLPVRLITAGEGGLPDFSGLELIARRQRSREERASHDSVVAAIGEAAARLQAEPDAAVALWQRHGRGIGGDAEQIVRASVSRFCTPIDRSAGRWQALRSLA